MPRLKHTREQDMSGLGGPHMNRLVAGAKKEPLLERFDITKGKLDAYINELRAQNSPLPFDFTVKVQHNDGSVLLLEYAFVVASKSFYFVYSEHNGYHAFYADDVACITQTKWVRIPTATKLLKHRSFTD